MACARAYYNHRITAYVLYVTVRRILTRLQEQEVKKYYVRQTASINVSIFEEIFCWKPTVLPALREPFWFFQIFLFFRSIIFVWLAFFLVAEGKKIIKDNFF